MKQHILASLLLSTLLVGGCSTFERVFPPSTATSQAYQTAEQVLTVAEDAHTTTGAILEAAAKSGLLHGTAAKTAQGYYDQAGGWLDKAEAAKTALDAPGILSAVSAANSFLGKADVLAKGN